MFRTLIAAVVALPMTVHAQDAQRIVSLGGSVTEVVFALDQQDRLVARDTTSNYPAAVEDLPDVGYVRRLTPEGVLSVNPDLILSIEGAGPPETLDVLKDAKVGVVLVPNTFTSEGVLTKIRTIGEALGQDEAAEALAKKVEQELTDAVAASAKMVTGEKPKVLFVLSTAGGRITAAGANTPASGILELAGAENAINDIDGFKQISDEAVVKSAPDAILMMQREGQFGVSDDDLFAMPAIALTPAAKSRKVVRMDGMHLLGFGPRTGSAILELAAALHGAPDQ